MQIESLKMNRMKFTVLVLLSLVSSFAYAEGDPEAGKSKSAVCAACHGADGISSIPGYPHIAGQNYDYLVAQLMAFKAGERKNGNAAIMAPMATGLSEQDMKDLAAYYSQISE